MYGQLLQSGRALILSDALHALYCITPVADADLPQPSWATYYRLWRFNMSAAHRRVGCAVGADPRILVLFDCGILSAPDAAVGKRLADLEKRIPVSMLTDVGVTPCAPNAIVTATTMFVLRRFYGALMLYAIADGVPVESVARAFEQPVPWVQEFVRKACSMASQVTTFCGELRWRTIALLAAEARTMLSRKVHTRVLPLLALPGVSTRLARALYKEGFKSVVSVAQAPSAHALALAIQAATPFRFLRSAGLYSTSAAGGRGSGSSGSNAASGTDWTPAAARAQWTHCCSLAAAILTAARRMVAVDVMQSGSGASALPLAVQLPPLSAIARSQQGAGATPLPPPRGATFPGAATSTAAAAVAAGGPAGTQDGSVGSPHVPAAVGAAEAEVDDARSLASESLRSESSDGGNSSDEDDIGSICDARWDDMDSEDDEDACAGDDAASVHSRGTHYSSGAEVADARADLKQLLEPSGSDALVRDALAAEGGVTPWESTRFSERHHALGAADADTVARLADGVAQERVELNCSLHADVFSSLLETHAVCAACGSGAASVDASMACACRRIPAASALPQLIAPAAPRAGAGSNSASSRPTPDCSAVLDGLDLSLFFDDDDAASSSAVVRDVVPPPRAAAPDATFMHMHTMKTDDGSVAAVHVAPSSAAAGAPSLIRSETHSTTGAHEDEEPRVCTYSVMSTSFASGLNQSRVFLAPAGASSSAAATATHMSLIAELNGSLAAQKQASLARERGLYALPHVNQHTPLRMAQPLPSADERLWTVFTSSLAAQTCLALSVETGPAPRCVQTVDPVTGAPHLGVVSSDLRTLLLGVHFAWGMTPCRRWSVQLPWLLPPKPAFILSPPPVVAAANAQPLVLPHAAVSCIAACLGFRRLHFPHHNSVTS
ncbi:MAG: hypothetical protein EOO41_01115, partial [Methanobacteriota archaeon]